MVRIRHKQGYLVDYVRESGSAFSEYLSQKMDEFKDYEKSAIAAWREGSSKLCGECEGSAPDDTEMLRIVVDFCQQFPEMVNFQNNHAVRSADDVPMGYFEYAPLISFAGA